MLRRLCSCVSKQKETKDVEMKTYGEKGKLNGRAVTKQQKAERRVTIGQARGDSPEFVDVSLD